MTPIDFRVSRSGDSNQYQEHTIWWFERKLNTDWSVIFLQYLYTAVHWGLLIFFPCLFSSPETKAHGELFWPLDVHHLSSNRQQCLKKSPSSKPLDRFTPNFTGMILGWPPFKIAQTVFLCWTRWPPELEIEKPLKKKLLLLKGWMFFEIIQQECTFGDSLPKLLTLFHYAEQDSHQSLK